MQEFKFEFYKGGTFPIYSYNSADLVQIIPIEHQQTTWTGA